MTDDKLLSQLETFYSDERLARFRNVARQRSRHLTLVLDHVHHPHNIAAVLRSADAFGLCEIHYVGSNWEYNEGISLGTEQWVQVIKHADSSSCIKTLLDNSYKIVLTAAPDDSRLSDKPSLPVYNLPFSEKLAIVFGNEKQGVSNAFQDAAQLTTYIPMLGFVESFNISVAAAITLFCSTVSINNNARQVNTLSEQDQRELYEQWLKTDLRHRHTVLAELSRRDKV